MRSFTLALLAGADDAPAAKAFTDGNELLRICQAAGYRFVPPDVPSWLVKIGQHLDPERAHGEFIGLAMFSKRGTDLLKSAYHAVSSKPATPFHEAPSLQKASLTGMLQELVARGHEVSCLTIYKGWMEVDTFEDYQQAWADLKK